MKTNYFETKEVILSDNKVALNVYLTDASELDSFCGVFNIVVKPLAINKFVGNGLCRLQIVPSNKMPFTKMRKEIEETLLSYYSLDIEKDMTADKIPLGLNKYPNIKTIFVKGLKLKKCGFMRESMDNMRLSLELVLNKLLDNSKTLENQTPDDVGKLLQDKACSQCAIKIFIEIKSTFQRFQNDNVKHKCLDKLGSKDVDFIVMLTTILIDYLLLE